MRSPRLGQALWDWDWDWDCGQVALFLAWMDGCMHEYAAVVTCESFLLLCKLFLFLDGDWGTLARGHDL